MRDGNRLDIENALIHGRVRKARSAPERDQVFRSQQADKLTVDGATLKRKLHNPDACVLATFARLLLGC